MLARRLDFNVMPRGHAGTWDSVQEFQIYRCIFARIRNVIVFNRVHVSDVLKGKLFKIAYALSFKNISQTQIFLNNAFLSKQ